jgi:cytochrome c oxidase assembly protein subunit 15
MGWYMVQSGLIDRPSVSQYRLAAHLGLAVLIYSLLVWFALDLLAERRRVAPAAGTPPLRTSAAGTPRLRGHAWAAIGCVGVTILWGALVAGLDAGLAYNSFPLMNGYLLPPEAWGASPRWTSPFETTAMVQFVHRWLGVVTAIVVLGLAWRAHALRSRSRVHALAVAAGAAVVVQVGLGIATLLLMVPIPLAALHQAGALVVLTALLWLVFELRPPRRAPSGAPA